jgi:hypothetical protein
MSRALPALALLLASACAADDDALRADLSRADVLAMSREDERAFAAAALELAARGDAGTRIRLELHLDRDAARRKRLPESCRVAAARALGAYPGSASAEGTLWGVLKDPAEAPAVRGAAFLSLRAFHPADLESRVAALPCPPADAWLGDLQRTLR